MNVEDFWLRVRKEVDRQHTSFEWLYQKTEIPKGTFASWKNRDTIPRADAAYRIASALGVSVEYLLTGFDAKKQPSNPAIQDIVDELISFDYIDLSSVQALVEVMATRYA
jgi:transcriptional regulator with XRE-family HTH domain